METPDGSTSEETGIAWVLPINVSWLSKISTGMSTGKSLSKWTCICPLSRYFSPFKLMGCTNKKIKLILRTENREPCHPSHNLFPLTLTSHHTNTDKNQTEIYKKTKIKERKNTSVEYHTDRSDVSTLRLELPKEIHESIKWSSWIPGDVTQVLWEPLCNLETIIIKVFTEMVWEKSTIKCLFRP